MTFKGRPPCTRTGPDFYGSDRPATLTTLTTTPIPLAGHRPQLGVDIPLAPCPVSRPASLCCCRVEWTKALAPWTGVGGGVEGWGGGGEEKIMAPSCLPRLKAASSAGRPAVLWNNRVTWLNGGS